jgi:hypothetical protein
LLHVAK